MLSRDDACCVIGAIINSGIIDEDLVSDLQDISTAIGCEKDSLHLWGVDDQDVHDLYTCVRSDLITPEYQKHVDDLYNKYKFFPSEAEKNEIDIDEEDEEEGDEK